MTGASGSDPVYYFEGTAEGYALKEIAATLQVTLGGATSSDTVNVTVTPVLQSFAVTPTQGAVPGLFPVGGGTVMSTNYGSPQGTPAVGMNGKAYNSGVNGELAFIQNTQIVNYIGGKNGAARDDGISWLAKFGVVNGVDYGGKVILDSDANHLPFYVLNHSVTATTGLQTVTDDDTPKVPVDTVLPVVLGGVTYNTTVDFGASFSTYAVWKYSDGTFYPLGNTAWNYRVKGVISYSIAQSKYVLAPDPLRVCPIRGQAASR